jgi:hypothetical protein
MTVEQAELAEIIEWRATLERLYRQIRIWLAEMDPAPTVEVSSTRIIEKRSGEYEAPMLVVSREEGSFNVQPVARWVVAAEGRVDLRGGGGRFILVQASENDPAVNDESGREAKDQEVNRWCWLQDRRPWKPVQLTGELFRDLIESFFE